MRVGKLRHRVTIEGLVSGSPEYSPSGEPNVEWGEIATVWASIEPLNGKELFAAQAVHAEITARIRIRWRSGIEPAMRVRHESRLYNIHSIIDPELRHMELQLMTGEGVNLG